MEAGKLPASPKPKRNRISAKPAAAPVNVTKAKPVLGSICIHGRLKAGKRCAKPWHIAAKLQRPTKMMKPFLRPMRSMMRPDRTIPIA